MLDNILFVLDNILFRGLQFAVVHKRMQATVTTTVFRLISRWPLLEFGNKIIYSDICINLLWHVNICVETSFQIFREMCIYKKDEEWTHLDMGKNSTSAK